MHCSLSISLLVIGFFLLGRYNAKTEIEQGFVINIPDPNLITPVFRIRFLVVLLSFDYSLDKQNHIIRSVADKFPS